MRVLKNHKSIFVKFDPSSLNITKFIDEILSVGITQLASRFSEVDKKIPQINQIGIDMDAYKAQMSSYNGKSIQDLVSNTKFQVFLAQSLSI